ncbi:hypothetical protein [Pseudohoeflea suaedae]|uniref:hypothetical protein n=1 Tax=Pseudohoeflea suaedae TaxID=877384 RepID=UPI001304CCFB|nr:hypothetical protein [Pseudohoeflea suaedae]
MAKDPTAAERMRRLRERQRSGKMPVLVDVDEVQAVEFLIAVGWLPEELADDKRVFALALSFWLKDAMSPEQYDFVTASRREELRRAMIGEN